MGDAPQNRSRGQKKWLRLPCPGSALMRRLAEKKGCFCGRFAEPFAKLILTRTVRAVPGRRKNKKIRNPGINGQQAGVLFNSPATLTWPRLPLFRSFFGLRGNPKKY